MPLSRQDLTQLLADLDAAVPGLREAHDDDLLEAIASMGEDIADQAGHERCWVEEQVGAILRRHGLIEAWAMCYSAQVKADYRKLVRTYGAVMSLEDFAKLYFHDPGKARPKT